MKRRDDMMNFLLVKFSLDREFNDYMQMKFLEFENIGVEIDDPIEKRDLLSELPEWEISDIKIEDDGKINYGIYFEDTEDGQSEKEKFINFLEKEFENIDIKDEKIDNSNWEDEWKKSYRAFKVGDRVIVKPSWEDIEDSDKIIIEIDPKMAFGSGTHETTSMCMEYIQDYKLDGLSVLDIGCGSGILSILSKKLGASKVDACDIDEIAISSTEENAKINEVEINAFESNLFSNVEGKYDIIFANILAEILVEMLKNTDEHLNENGFLILSGIINEKENLVIESLEKNNFKVADIKRKGEWSLIKAERNA